MKRFPWFLILVGALVLLAAPPAQASEAQPTKALPLAWLQSGSGGSAVSASPSPVGTSTITGKVVDNAGRPYDGVTVLLLGAFEYVAKTGADGSYSFVGPAGRYTVSPRCTDGTEVINLPYLCPAPKKVLDVAAGATVTADLVAVRAGKVEGMIVGTWPVKPFTVMFDSVAASHDHWGANINSDGSFVIYSNSHSDVRVRLLALEEGWWADWVPALGESAQFTIGPGKTVRGVQVLPFTATPSSAPSTSSQPAGAGLPSTGTSGAPLLAAGVLLLCTGAVLVAIEGRARRRQH